MKFEILNEMTVTGIGYPASSGSIDKTPDAFVKKPSKRVKPNTPSGTHKYTPAEILKRMKNKKKKKTNKIKERKEITSREQEEIRNYFFDLGIKCYVQLNENYQPEDYKDLLEFIESDNLTVTEIYSIIFKTSDEEFPPGYNEVYSAEQKLETVGPGESLEFFKEGFEGAKYRYE